MSNYDLMNNKAKRAACAQQLISCEISDEALSDVFGGSAEDYEEYVCCCFFRTKSRSAWIEHTRTCTWEPSYAVIPGTVIPYNK